MRTTVSRSSGAAAGPPCGSALAGPNCTSPPPSAPRCCISRDSNCATSRSVVPPASCPNVAAIAPSVISIARRMSATSSGALMIRSRSVTGAPSTNCEPQVRLIAGGRLQRDRPPAARGEAAHGVTNERVRIGLLLPAADLRDRAVALDALHLERRAHDHGRAARRQHQGDQPLAPAGIVGGQILVVGRGRRDQEVEPPRRQLRLGPREAAAEHLRGQGGFLGRLNAERGTRNAELWGGHSVPPFDFRVPRSVRPRNRPCDRQEFPPFHAASPPPACGLYYPPSSNAGRCRSR